MFAHHRLVRQPVGHIEQQCLAMDLHPAPQEAVVRIEQRHQRFELAAQMLGGIGAQTERAVVVAAHGEQQLRNDARQGRLLGPERLGERQRHILEVGGQTAVVGQIVRTVQQDGSCRQRYGTPVEADFGVSRGEQHQHQLAVEVPLVVRITTVVKIAHKTDNLVVQMRQLRPVMQQLRIIVGSQFTHRAVGFTL